MQQSQTPLAASFVAVPPTHDGETPFWLELSFDAPLAQGSKPQLRGAAQRDRWSGVEIPAEGRTARPLADPGRPVLTERGNSDARRRPRPCGESGAVCTDDGRTFTTGLRDSNPRPRERQQLVGRLGRNRSHTRSRTTRSRASASSVCCWRCSGSRQGTKRPSPTRRLKPKITRHQELETTGTSATPSRSCSPRPFFYS